LKQMRFIVEPDAHDPSEMVRVSRAVTLAAD
jgi:hypothetical protein